MDPASPLQQVTALMERDKPGSGASSVNTHTILICDEIRRRLTPVEELEVKRVLGIEAIERNESLAREAASLAEVLVDLSEAHARQGIGGSRRLQPSQPPRAPSSRHRPASSSSTSVKDDRFERSALTAQISFFVERLRRASIPVSLPAAALAAASSTGSGSARPRTSSGRPPQHAHAAGAALVDGSSILPRPSQSSRDAPSSAGSRPESGSTVSSIAGGHRIDSAGGGGAAVRRPATGRSSASGGSYRTAVSSAREVVDAATGGAALSMPEEHHHTVDGSGGGIVAGATAALRLSLWDDGDPEVQRVIHHLRSAIADESEDLEADVTWLRAQIEECVDLGDTEAEIADDVADGADNDDEEEEGDGEGDGHHQADLEQLRHIKQGLQQQWLEVEQRREAAADGQDGGGDASDGAHASSRDHGGSSRIAARLRAAKLADDPSADASGGGAGGAGGGSRLRALRGLPGAGHGESSAPAATSMKPVAPLSNPAPAVDEDDDERFFS